MKGLTQVTDQTERQRFWREWLSTQISMELLGKISGITEREDALVVFAESAAWCARLRYRLLELESAVRALRPQLGVIEVRVLPRG